MQVGCTMPALPKRPISAFFMFKADVYQKIKEENPEAKLTELAKIISMRWNELDKTEREKYKQRDECAQAIYAREISIYEAKHGKIEKKKRRKKGGKKAKEEEKDEENEEEEEEEDKKKKKKKKEKNTEINLVCEHKDKIPKMEIQYQNGFSLSLGKHEFKKVEVREETIKYLTQHDQWIIIKVPPQ